jgi:hypothetical protein
VCVCFLFAVCFRYDSLHLIIYTRYARATMAAMHYLLRTRGLSSVKSKCMRVALRAQFLEMVRNDLQYVDLCVCGSLFSWWVSSSSSCLDVCLRML